MSRVPRPCSLVLLTSRGDCQFQADLFELAKLGGAELAGHRASDAPGVPAPDPLLERQAFAGQREADAAPVAWVCLALNEPAVRQPVHQPGQGRLAEQHVPVQLAKAHRLGALGQGVEDVVLPHGDVLPDVLRGELLYQRRVGGQQGLPRVVGEVPALFSRWHRPAGFSRWHRPAGFSRWHRPAGFPRWHRPAGFPRWHGRVGGHRSVGPQRSGYSAWNSGAVSWYGDDPVTLSPRFAFGRGCRGDWSPYFALTRLSCVGASGVSGSRRAAISLRSTGMTSPPSNSSWLSTVFSGRPAWSIRNSWRW